MVEAEAPPPPTLPTRPVWAPLGPDPLHDSRLRARPGLPDGGLAGHAFALLAALLGVPFGIAGGRWAWRLVADKLGVASGPVVPSAPVLAIAAGALLAANLAAAGPGWAAARIQPAAVLRSE